MRGLRMSSESDSDRSRRTPGCDEASGSDWEEGEAGDGV